jgi:hypothetical protein
MFMYVFGFCIGFVYASFCALCVFMHVYVHMGCETNLRMHSTLYLKSKVDSIQPYVIECPTPTSHIRHLFLV